MNAQNNMKMITIFVPPPWLPMLETLVRLGHAPNRSELMRTAIKTYLEKYEKQLEGVGYNITGHEVVTATDETGENEGTDEDEE